MVTECPCGSKEYPDSLYDARGIFCCYYCSKCEKEQKGKYRVEVLEDSNYDSFDDRIEEPD